MIGFCIFSLVDYLVCLEDYLVGYFTLFSGYYSSDSGSNVMMDSSLCLIMINGYGFYSDDDSISWTGSEVPTTILNFLFSDGGNSSSSSEIESFFLLGV